MTKRNKKKCSDQYIRYSNNNVNVSAPTGSTAFNVSGETIHRMFKMKCKKMEQEI
jgi:hypothetical protein